MRKCLIVLFGGVIILQMPGMREIAQIAQTILEADPDPVVRFRLLRDVLRSHRGVRAAQREAMKSRWIAELAREQREDGSWGRFHSADTKLKQKNPTTEAAVARAMQLGLDRTHPILRRASKYIEKILAGELAIPDYQEKNERWPTGVKLFAASTLAQIDPQHRAVKPVAEMWLEIACETFAKGKFDASAEATAHRRLTGIRGELRYLTIFNAHVVRLLATRVDQLPRRIQRAFLKELFSGRRTLAYANASLRTLPTREVEYVKILSPLEIVSHLPAWREFAAPSVPWLWSIRGYDDFWNFPPTSGLNPHRPLSSDWRTKNARRNDSTVRVLKLLRKYYE